jgi:hypothetical protein
MVPVKKNLTILMKKKFLAEAVGYSVNNILNCRWQECNMSQLVSPADVKKMYR